MDTQLRQKLTELHAKLEQTQMLDDESRQLLEHLQHDIQAVLNESNPSTRQSLRNRLSAAIAHWEISHPRLTLVLKQVLDNLAQI